MCPCCSRMGKLGLYSVTVSSVMAARFAHFGFFTVSYAYKEMDNGTYGRKRPREEDASEDSSESRGRFNGAIGAVGPSDVALTATVRCPFDASHGDILVVDLLRHLAKEHSGQSIGSIPGAISSSRNAVEPMASATTSISTAFASPHQPKSNQSEVVVHPSAQQDRSFSGPPQHIAPSEQMMNHQESSSSRGHQHLPEPAVGTWNAEQTARTSTTSPMNPAASGSLASDTLHLGYPKGVDPPPDSAIAEVFQPFYPNGRLVVRHIRSKGCFFVEFGTADNAQHAYQRFSPSVTIAGVRMRVNFSTARKQQPQQPTSMLPQSQPYAPAMASGVQPGPMQAGRGPSAELTVGGAPPPPQPMFQNNFLTAETIAGTVQNTRSQGSSMMGNNYQQQSQYGTAHHQPPQPAAPSVSMPSRPQTVAVPTAPPAATINPPATMTSSNVLVLSGLPTSTSQKLVFTRLHPHIPLSITVAGPCAFCVYSTHDAAAQAMNSLRNVTLRGQPLKVSLL